MTDTQNDVVKMYPAGGVVATRQWGGRGSPSSVSLSDPRGVAVTSGGMLVVCDAGFNRVVGYPFEGASATQLFGQVNFSSSLANQGGAASAQTLWRPTSIVLDPADNVYVAYRNNNRVLFFTAGASMPSRVYGQAFFENSPGSGSARLNNPDSLALDNNLNLYVSDDGNDRIVVFPRDGRQVQLLSWVSLIFSLHQLMQALAS